MAHDVFISYSHKDKVVADAICARLESESVRCWYAPRDIVPGADWAASIIEAINTSKIMVLIFTDFSNVSTQVLREVNNAVSSGLPIIPFKLTNTLPTEGMQYYLSTVHWLDAIDTPLENSIEKLLHLTKGLLEGEAQHKTETPTAETPSTTTPSTGQGSKVTTPLVPPVHAKMRVVPIAIGGALILIALIGAVVLFAGQGTSSTQASSSAEESSGAIDSVTESIATYKEGESFTIDDPTNTGTQGNLQCNYLNNGIATSDGTWIYYQSNDSQSIYRMRLDGTEKTQLNDQASNSLGVVDGLLYYRTSSGIYCMNTDGSDDTNLFLGTVEHMSIVDGRIFFKSSEDKLRLYSMALDGTDLKKENDIQETYDLNFWNGKIYWSNNDDAKRVYRANLDGSDATVLTKSSAEALCVVDGWLFYYDMNEYESRVINLKTLESYRAHPKGFYSPTISEAGIIGKIGDSNLELCRAQLNSSGTNVILDENVDDICIVEGHVFYRGEDHQIHMMDVDGKNDVVL